MPAPPPTAVTFAQKKKKRSPFRGKKPPSPVGSLGKAIVCTEGIGSTLGRYKLPKGDVHDKHILHPMVGWFRPPHSGHQPMASMAPLGGMAGHIKPTEMHQGPSNVLVLYDSTGQYGFLGNLYATMLADMLTHYNVGIYLEPIETYTSGQMSGFSATFYLGILYGNPLPSAFQSDALSTTSPLVWLGYNIWDIAWSPDWTEDNAAFTSAFGFQFDYMADPIYPTVTYNGATLAEDPNGGGQGLVTITNPTQCSTLAVSNGTDGSQIPYMVHGGNLWYVGENPLCDNSTWLTSDRSMILADVIHDVLNDGVQPQHNAVLRIEDVDAWSDPTQLMAIADLLSSMNVPFAVCVIPEYVDAFGIWNYGVPVDETINDQPALVAALQYMASKGGEIVMHGETHQYDTTDNPYDGVSADDYEFFRMVQDADGDVIPNGPVTEDSPSWIHAKMQLGLNILSQAGFTANGWNTPHYMATPTDYAEFADDFAFSMCRGKPFAYDSDGYLYWMEQATVFPIVDSFGMLRLPETLGYVTTPQYSGITNSGPADLAARAQNLMCVRDGWAGMFFHAFLPTSLLQQLVQGIQADGFTFVSPTAAAAAARNDYDNGPGGN